MMSSPDIRTRLARARLRTAVEAALCPRLVEGGSWWLTGSASRGDDAWFGAAPVSDVDLLYVADQHWMGSDLFTAVRARHANGNQLWRIDAQQIRRADLPQLNGFIMAADLSTAVRLAGEGSLPSFGPPTMASARVLVLNRYYAWLQAADPAILAGAGEWWERLLATQRAADILLALVAAHLVARGRYASSIDGRLAAWSQIAPDAASVGRVSEAARLKRAPDLGVDPAMAWRRFAPLALDLLADLLGCRADVAALTDAISTWTPEQTPSYVEGVPPDPRRTPLTVKGTTQQAAIVLAHGWDDPRTALAALRAQRPVVAGASSWAEARALLLAARRRAKAAA